MIRNKIFLIAACLFCLAASWPVQMLHGEWVLNFDEEGTRTFIFKSDSTFTAIARFPFSNDTLSGTYTFRSGVLGLKDNKDAIQTDLRVVVLNESMLGILDEEVSDKDTIYFRKVK